MATTADVRRIALALDDVMEATDDFAFTVPVKGAPKKFLWCWKERVHPKKPRVPNMDVLAVRVASLTDKDLLISAHPKKFFTEPHYDGFPAVLVRLKEIKVSELRPLIADARASLLPRAKHPSAHRNS